MLVQQVNQQLQQVLLLQRDHATLSTIPTTTKHLNWKLESRTYRVALFVWSYV